MRRIVFAAAVFTVIAGGVLAWYAFFKTPEGIPSLLVIAHIDPQSTAKRGCVRRLALVVTVLNKTRNPSTIAAVRFLAGRRTSLDAGVSPRRVGGQRQLVLRFDVAPVYARLRRQGIGRSITRVEVRDATGIRYRSPVELNIDARICGE